MKELNFEAEYKKLNKAQKEAVDSIYGPVMVVAGPGTGKTQIIGLRTANIILKTGINPENILITTFTEAGVIAIKKRLVKFLGTEGYKVKVSTFHAFCSDIISDFPEKFLEQRAKKTIDDIESYEILSEILDSFIESGEVKELFSSMDRFAYLRDIKDRISKLKTEGINHKYFEKIIENLNLEYEQKLLDLENNKRIRDLEKRRALDKKTYDTHINKLKELNLIFEAYNSKIREKGLYDFSDMINFVTEKFQTDDEILAHYAEKFQFMMIDEFQDTNNSQNQVIDLILSYFPDENNIMVVGDDDQSIYRFQGANIENMLDFSSKYPDTKHIVLDQNYRSSQDILDLSQNLIENNNGRISNRIKGINKNLKAEGEFKDLKENDFFILENDLKEKEFVYSKIKEKNNENETFAIILKTNKQVQEWSKFLISKGLKVNSKNNANILNNRFCNLLLDFLSFINDQYFDDSKLLDLLRSDLIDVKNIDVITLSRSLYQLNYSRSKFKKGIWDLIKDIEKDEFLYDKINDLEKITIFRDKIIELTTSLGNNGINSLFKNILEYLNIFEFIEQKGDFNDLQDIFTLVNKIKSFVENNKDITISEIINKFSLYKKYNIAINREAIKSISSNIEILTAHSSKGLEYDYVFLPQVYEGNWNAKKSPDMLKLPIGMTGLGLQYSDLDEKEIKNLEKEISTEEERRLFFVAITRAKKSLIFTFPAGKENKALLQSSFVSETNIEAKQTDIEVNEEQLKQILIESIIEPDLVSFGEDEINFISMFLENYKLSPTDLNKFIEDPKRFLRETIFRYPFLSNENLVFGTIYHKVLEDAYIYFSNNNSYLTLEDMQKIFLEQVNNYDLTSDELERLKQRGLEGLKGYYEIYKTNKRKTLKTEYNFRSKDIVFEGVPLTGKIDKIEIIGTSVQPSTLEEKEQSSLFTESVALVDYKTGKVKTNGVIKGLDRYGNKKNDSSEGGYARQLMFYKLMFENTSELSSNYTIGELALDFVEGKNGEYKYISVDFTDEEYEEFKQELKEAREKINSLEFWRGIIGER